MVFGMLRAFRDTSPVRCAGWGSVVKRVAGLLFVLLSSLWPLSGQAADAPLYPPELFAPQAPPLEMDFGVRYWYSLGRAKKTLFDSTGGTMLSQLTWKDLTGHAGEGYFNITQNDVFVKGFIGAAVFSGGRLQDEDFPPAASPYSSTNSNSRDGRFEYASVDLGYYLLNGPRGKLGGFVGYFYDREKMTAFGCTQTTGNTDICTPAIPGNILALSQEYRWHALRLGVAGEVSILPNLRLTADAAWLPYVNMNGSDWHWLRIGTDFNGPTPETGHGTGFQADAVLNYTFDNGVTLGAGGRYWHFDTPNGTAHFETSVIGGALPQVEKFKSDRYGVFVQLGVKY